MINNLGEEAWKDLFTVVLSKRGRGGRDRGGCGQVTMWVTCQEPHKKKRTVKADKTDDGRSDS